MKYKALITDIDGTLTLPMTKDRKNPLPSQKVDTAIQRAQAKVHIGLATGRSSTLTKPIFEHLNLNGLSIVQNGALIVNGLSQEVLWEKQISSKDYTSVTNFFLKHGFNFVIDEITKTAIPYTKTYKPNEVVTLFVSELSEKQADFVEKELSKISTIKLHKVPSWTPTLWGLNITDSGASKQHAVLEFAKIHNIHTDEIIAIGDSYNDFPLLMACGLKVAMGNALPELKAIADYIAPSVEEDGVAHVIEKFVLNSA